MQYGSTAQGTGVQNGTFSYSWTQLSYFTYLSSQNYSILYQFNQWRGEDPAQADPFVTQWRFRSGPGCPGGCETATVNTSMPHLWLNTTVYGGGQVDSTVTYNGASCYKFNLIATTQQTGNLSGVQNIWFTAPTGNPTICKVLFNTGDYYDFINVNSNPTFSSTQFTSPSNCTCSEPVDIALVLDRSGSITIAQFQQMYSFLQGFGSSFQWSNSKGNLAIVNFNTAAFGTYNPTSNTFGAPPLLPLTGDPTIVTNTLKALNCCVSNSDTSQSCCDGWTAISAGIRAGVDTLSTAKGGRPNAAKVVILITDGKQNTLYEGSGGGCYYGGSGDCCEFGIGNNCPDDITGPGVYPGAQYLYCLGDSNYDFIPDVWQSTPLKPVAWSCTGTSTTNCCNGYKKCNPTNSCNGTYCSTNSAYLKNRMAVCNEDLINAREYGFQNLGTSTYYYAIGVGQVSPAELAIVTNNRFKRPASATVSVPITWTPSYNVADNTNPERVMLVSSWSVLSGYLLELTSKVCNVPATPCGSCCSLCLCGACIPPTTCLQPANQCQQSVVQAGCCVIQNKPCPAKNCQTLIGCDPTLGCQYTPTICGTDPCYTYSCNNVTGQCISTSRVPAANACFNPSCDSKGNIIYNPTSVNTACVNTACASYACNNQTGCIATSTVANPLPPNACLNFACDPKTGWGSSVKVTCTPSDACNNYTCNTLTGLCGHTVKSCRNASNLCDVTQCDPTNGCPASPTLTTCSPQADLCLPLPTCNPSTGQCQNGARKTCTSPDCRAYTCDAASGNCTTTQTACAGICATINCGSSSNQCWTATCNQTEFKANCDILTPVNCNLTIPIDYCTISTVCNNQTGCAAVPAPPCGTPTNSCNIFVRDGTYPGCCKEVQNVVCPAVACATSTCNAATGLCDTTLNCNLTSTACHIRGCSNDTCVDTPIPCVHQNCKVDVECIDGPIDGLGAGCQDANARADIDCDDQNACTLDLCDNSTGLCTHSNVTCGANETDMCIVWSCDPNYGCVHSQMVCDDGINCTADSCVSSTGCVFVPVDSLCNDNNLCTNDSCSATEGCLNTYYNCSGATECQINVCRPLFGCQYDTMYCWINETNQPEMLIDYDADNSLTEDEKANLTAAQNAKVQGANNNRTNQGDCSYAVCQNSTCVKKTLPCAAAGINVAVLAGGLAAGAIAGIAIAAIVAALITGGGVYYAASNAGDGAAATVGTNPLYQESGNSANNPMYDPNDQN